MSYTVMATQPAPRDPTLPDAVIGPGLYTNEIAVTLDTGQNVAVYVDATPPDNNAGITFYASARAINADGSTQLHQPGAVQMVTEFYHPATQQDIAAYTSAALAKCMLLAVLGEPITTVPVPNPLPPPAPQTMLMVGWDAGFLANASIRMFFAASTAATSVNAGSILG